MLRSKYWVQGFRVLLIAGLMAATLTSIGIASAQSKVTITFWNGW